MVKRLLTYLAVASATLLHCHGVDTRILHPDISTLQVHRAGSPLEDAVITLSGGNDQGVVIEWDERASDTRHMRYNLTHCNVNWEPSSLIDSDIVDGFNEWQVTDYAFSRGTSVQYIHYRITLPGEEMKFKTSGNYIVTVWDEDDPDTPLLRARIMVTEQSVGVNGSVSTVTDVDYNDSHQQLSLEINTERTEVSDLLGDFTVNVTQNNRRDNVVTLTRPSSLRGRHLVYEHVPTLIFDGGNEYRRFEAISTQFPGIHIADNEWLAPYYRTHVETDQPRAGQPYNYDQTAHGRYLVREYNSTESDIEADYVVATLTLQSPPLEGMDIFIEGDITGRRLDDTSLMNYNPLTGCYEKNLLLKQGAYNYQYLARPSGTDGVGLTAPIEGNHYNTVNEYTVTVYQRRPGERADRLVGYYSIKI